MALAFTSSLPLLPRAEALPSSTSPRVARVRMDVGAPPESRISPNFAAATRFEAPFLNLTAYEGFPSLNGMTVNMAEVPLDLDHAAEVAAPLLGYVVLDESKTSAHGLDVTTLFDTKTTNTFAENPSDKYYPMARRDETPIIELTPPGSEASAEPSISISIGEVVATPPPDSPDPTPPGFWKLPTQYTEPAYKVVDSNFPERFRYLAPLISFEGNGVSVAMTKVLGEPDPSLYPESFDFHALQIRMQVPKYLGDPSAFIEVSSPEMQLPMNNTV